MFKRIIFVFLIIMAFLYFDHSKEKDKMVFEDLVNDYYDVFSLEIDNLSTKNILDYFNDEDRVLEIRPKDNKIYDTGIKSYIFNSMHSNLYNIKRFVDYYLDKVDIYYNEKERYMLEGIPIDRVLVYTSKAKIDDLAKNYKVIVFNSEI